MNDVAADITALFKSTGVDAFEKLPNDKQACAKFADLFKTFNKHLEAAKVQGVHWNELSYEIAEQSADYTVEQLTSNEVALDLDEQTYLRLALRYKELAREVGSDNNSGGDVPFDISGYLTEIDTGKIDADYMNSRFDKFLRALNQDLDPASIELTLNKLHKSFSSLTQAEQKYAKLFLHDLQRGEAQIIKGHTFRDYINSYQAQAENAQVNAVVSALGLDENLLMALMSNNLNEKNLHEFGRFDALIATVDKEKAKVYLEKLDGKTLSRFVVSRCANKFLKQFVLEQQAD